MTPLSLPVLFLLADVVSGRAVLSQTKGSDVSLTGLGALLTSVYIFGLVFRPRAWSGGWAWTRWPS